MNEETISWMFLFRALKELHTITQKDITLSKCLIMNDV